ncbi:hypothetical protein JAAARDRAFT_37180 [Jaapia argillacea MUCL 33604]|uniref:Uncharacterized protein n=1 Tax=Jaapia argillacea MUCL 33604 TaxID=933084 RepID=A0A067PPM1_9AGAM|nr:hypothetical protein JAAARDRAFT_37180 [Jaapia argillacea MUCL 33604]
MPNFILFKSSLKRAERHLSSGIDIIEANKDLIHQKDVQDTILLHEKLCAAHLSIKESAKSFPGVLTAFYRVPFHVNQCYEFESLADMVSGIAKAAAMKEYPAGDKPSQTDSAVAAVRAPIENPGAQRTVAAQPPPLNVANNESYSSLGSSAANSAIRGWRTDEGITFPIQSADMQTLVDILQEHGFRVDLQTASIMPPSSSHVPEEQETVTIISQLTRIATRSTFASVD